MAKTNPAAPVRVIEETSAYWRVVFDYPPFNIVDATIFEGLQDLHARMDASPSLRVVVFESANPEFYLAHFDLTGKTGNITTAVGPSGLPILIEVIVWIAHGKSNRDISEILGISPRTVNKHLEQIFTKLGVENRASAAAQATRVLALRD